MRRNRKSDKAPEKSSGAGPAVDVFRPSTWKFLGAAWRPHLREHKEVYIGLAAALVMLGLLILLGESRYDRVHARQSWPVVKAKIVRSAVTESVPLTRGAETTLEARLVLKYEVNGKPYTSSYIHVWGRSVRDLDYQTLLAEGREIEVRYSPEDPTVCSLYPLVPW